MKDRFNRAKQFVVNHRGSIVGTTAGLAVGATLTHRYHLNIYQMKRWGLGITTEQLQKMLDNPSYEIPYDFEGIGKFNLHHIDLSKLK